MMLQRGYRSATHRSTRMIDYRLSADPSAIRSAGDDVDVGVVRPAGVRERCSVWDVVLRSKSRTAAVVKRR